MDILKKYFHLTPHQEQQFAALGELYPEWNQKINVISRKDIGNLYEHHILHSMAIAKIIHFQPGTRVMDIGTGGGFPGIPLAILYPETHFTLIDSIGKKIRVAQEIASAIGLTNVDIRQLRAEEEKGKYDFIVSRAVMPLGDLKKLVQKNITKEQKNAIPSGLIVLKGGDLQAELFPFRNIAEVQDIYDLMPEALFKTKKVI